MVKKRDNGRNYGGVGIFTPKPPSGGATGLRSIDRSILAAAYNAALLSF